MLREIREILERFHYVHENIRLARYIPLHKQNYDNYLERLVLYCIHLFVNKFIQYTKILINYLQYELS